MNENCGHLFQLITLFNDLMLMGSTTDLYLFIFCFTVYVSTTINKVIRKSKLDV